ncbi:MAG TPA: glycoside hydrolase family 13 [bacterium]|nr:glycoside hydrolase family 13 [bacterium]
MPTPVLERPLREVLFRFEGRLAPLARAVELVGSFNDWSAQPLDLGTDGWWTLELSLRPGEHEYLFLVDGTPWNDPNDDGRMANPWGGHYSLRVVV